MSMEDIRRWLDAEPIGNVPGGAVAAATFHDEARDVHGISFELEDSLVFLVRVHAPLAKRIRVALSRRGRPYWNRQSRVRVNRSLYLDYLGLVRGVFRERVRLSPMMRIVVAGESYGAAVARLAALDLAVNFPERRVSCLVLAPPRFGNQAFEASFARRVPAYSEEAAPC